MTIEKRIVRRVWLREGDVVAVVPIGTGVVAAPEGDRDYDTKPSRERHGTLPPILWTAC